MGTCFGKEKKLRRLMLLLGLLAALMLVASPVLAHKGGPHHGNKYSKNYYPNAYFKYFEPDGSRYYGNDKPGNAAWRRSLHLVVVDGYAGRRMLR